MTDEMMLLASEAIEETTDPTSLVAEASAEVISDTIEDRICDVSL